MNSEVNVQEKRKRDKKKLIGLLGVILLAGIAVLFLVFYNRGEDKTTWLKRQLQDSSEKTIEIDENIYITESLVINGNKTISGTGTIVYRPKKAEKLKLEEYRIPEDECQATKIADLSEVNAMFDVSDGGQLTITGSVTVDANNKALGVKVDGNGTLTVSDSAVLTGGLGSNILNGGSLTISGGRIEAENGYNIMTNGRMLVTDGEITGSGKRLMNIVASGTVDIEGGAVSGAQGTNVYLTDGNISVSGGTIDAAELDNVFVENGEIEVTGGTIQAGNHGVHNTGTVVMTGGTYIGNTNNLYNEGRATVKNLSFGNSLAQNIVNTGKNAQMEMTDAVIESATTHGVYNARGAKLDVEKLTVKSALAKGIHNGGGYLTGKNITIVSTGGAGVGNEIEKGWTEKGKVTIEGLKVLKASNFNLLNSSGEMTIHDAELGMIATNSIQVIGGTLNLKDIEVAGTTGTGTSHGIYMLGGTINAENLSIERSVSRGIQNRGGQFNGKNITVKNISGTGIGNLVGVDDVSQGTITIDGLNVTGVKGYSIQNTNTGTINITNAVVEVANTTGVRIDDGAINLTDVKLIGVTSENEAASKYNGITAKGGTLTLKNTTIKSMLGRSISNEGAEIIGTNITVNGTGGSGVATLNGTTKINKLTTTGVYGYNVDAQGGKTIIIDGTLNSSETTNVRVKEGTLHLENVLVDGAPAVVAADGTVNKYNGITATGGNMVLKNVTVQNTAGRCLNCTGTIVTGENVVVKNATGTAVYNSNGSIDIDGLEASGGTGHNVDVQSGSVSLKNAVLGETKTTSVNIANGSLSLKNTLIDGAPAIADEKGEIKSYHGITANGGKVSLDTVTIQNTASRNLNNNAAEITGKNVVLKNAGTTSLYNNGTVTIDGLEIKGKEGIAAHNVDSAGTLTLKNATLCQTGTTSINLRQDSVTTLENVVIEGTTSGHGIYLKKSAALNFDGLTIKNVAGRALTNGYENIDGGTVNGKNLVVNTTGGTAVANVTGIMKIDGFEASVGTGHNVDVQSGSVSIENAVLGETKTTNVNIEKGSLSLKNALIDGAPAIADEKGEIKSYHGITANGGKVSLDTVTIQNTASRNLNNNAAEITGKKVVLKNAGTTSLYNNGTVTIDGLEIKGKEGIAAHNVDSAGTLTLKNATLCQTGTTSINLRQDSVTTLENVVIEGTTSGHGVYVKKNATLNFDGLTVKNVAGRALTNGYTNVEGGSVIGKKLVIDTTGGTAVANVTGTVKLDGVTIDGRTGYAVDNSETMELRNVEIEAYEKASAIKNTGELIVDGGTINAGTYAGINHVSGSVTLEGTLTVNTSSYPIYLDPDKEVETLNLAEGVTFIAESRINLPTSHVITVLGEIGNTPEQVIAFTPANVTSGTVYVDTPNVELAKKLADMNVFKPKGVSAIAGEGDNADKLVAGTVVFDEEATIIEVSTWADLKTAIENTEEGDNLHIVLLNNIDETEESVITVGLKATTKVTLSDNGKGYMIKRTDLTNALFKVNPVSVMNIDGTLTIDGASDKTSQSKEAIFLNEGTLTIGSGVTIKNGYKSSSDNSLSGTGKSAGAIESTGTLEINGTVTASGSKNCSAIAVLSGTFTTNGAKLNSNISSRAVRIASGTAVLTNTEICNNTFTTKKTSGAGLLIDNGSVTISGGTISNNKTYAYTNTDKDTDSNGAGIYVMNTASLTIENCTLGGNEAGGYGGAIGSTSSGKVKLTNCVLNGNKAGTHGAAIRINKKNSTSILEMIGCTVTNNTAAQQAGAIISNAKTVTMTNCTFTGNTAEGYVGVLFFNETNSQEVTLTDCEINSNTGTTGVGAIRIDNGKLTLNNCEVKDNIVTSGNAGAIWAGSSNELILNNTEISGNTASGSGNGGAIYVNNSGAITLNNCTVTGNSNAQGGAFYITHPSASVTVEGGTISNNVATTGRGGAVRIENGTITITGCTISDNSAPTSGGAFFINQYTAKDGTYYHGKVYMTSCTLNGNSSNGDGPTIHVAGTLSLKNCKINNISSVNDANKDQICQTDIATVTNEE
ncbi:MAG: right-handed parallel beta-helix repeat-containing protein [Tyzzerella sp.]|nr:right-handed parallel beta-helix repeat-containing protein [Tyzzerella sp.]